MEGKIKQKNKIKAGTNNHDYYDNKRLWFWLGGHGAETIEAVFMQSTLYRKEKGSGYPALTIRNAAKRWNGNYYGKRKYN